MTVELRETPAPLHPLFSFTAEQSGRPVRCSGVGDTRMKRLAIVTIAASALALTACASLAPYGQQMGPNGQGYSDQQIERDRFRVTYRGVGAPGPVADMALFRAAQLTVEQGYDWFEVTQRWIDCACTGAGSQARPSNGHNNRERAVDKQWRIDTA